MSDPSLDALARLAAAAQAMLDGACTCPTYAAWSPGCARSDCPCHGEHVPRAPDLARGLVAAVDALRAERERRDRMIASFGRLDMSAAELGNIVVAMRAKLDAAEAQRDALAAAVREYGDALAAEEAARLAWKAGCSAEEDDEADVPTFRGPLTTAYDAAMRRRVTALDALLRGAAAPVVRAEVAPPCAPSTCRSDDDGDCRWNRCPQRLDGEPWVTGRVCPLSKED